jgi:hypothetical protein
MSGNWQGGNFFDEPVGGRSNCAEALKSMYEHSAFHDDAIANYYRENCTNKHKPIDYSTISAKK